MTIPTVRVRISARQLMFLKLSGIMGTVFFGGIRALTEGAGAHGYLAILGGGILSFAVMILSVIVSRRFPAQTPFQYAKIIYGRWIGGVIISVFILATLAAGALITRSLGDYLITAILPDTPLSANMGLMLFLVCFGAYIGLEALARFNEFFAPIILISWITIVVVAIPKVDLGWFRPILDITPARLAMSTLIAGTLLIDALSELMFYSFVTDKQVIVKYLTWAIIAGTSVVLLLQVTIIGVYSPSLATTFTFPVLQLAQDVTLGVFLERTESVFLAVWIVGTFIRVATVFYGAALGLAQTFGIKNHRFFILPLAVGAFYLAVQAGNVPQSLNYDAIFQRIGLVVQISIPTLLLVGAIIQRKRGRSTHDPTV